MLRHRLGLINQGHLFYLDSAGTQSYHTGEQPDPRTQSVARMRGIQMESLRARPVSLTDFNEFDLLMAMDKTHLEWLKAKAPEGAAEKVKLYLEYVGIDDPLEVPDPYYGKTAHFEAVLDLIERATELLIARLGRDMAAM